MCMLSRGSSFISLIFDGDIIRYFTSFICEDGFLILHEGKKYLFTDKRYYYLAKSVANAQVELISNDSLQSFVIKHGVDTVGLIYSLTTVSDFNKVIDLNLKTVDIETDVNSLREVKSNYELGLIQKAQEIAEKSFTLCALCNCHVVGR